MLVIFFVYGIWKTGIKAWMIFGAITGLFIGYGVGGDVWGARLFDIFTGENTRYSAEDVGKTHTKSDDDHVA